MVGSSETPRVLSNEGRPRWVGGAVTMDAAAVRLSTGTEDEGRGAHRKHGREEGGWIEVWGISVSHERERKEDRLTRP